MVSELQAGTNTKLFVHCFDFVRCHLQKVWNVLYSWSVFHYLRLSVLFNFSLQNLFNALPCTFCACCFTEVALLCQFWCIALMHAAHLESLFWKPLSAQTRLFVPKFGKEVQAVKRAVYFWSYFTSHFSFKCVHVRVCCLYVCKPLLYKGVIYSRKTICKIPSTTQQRMEVKPIGGSEQKCYFMPIRNS